MMIFVQRIGSIDNQVQKLWIIFSKIRHEASFLEVFENSYQSNQLGGGVVYMYLIYISPLISWFTSFLYYPKSGAGGNLLIIQFSN